MAAVRSNDLGRPRPRFKDFVCVGSDMEILLNGLSVLPKKIMPDVLRSTVPAIPGLTGGSGVKVSLI